MSICLRCGLELLGDFEVLTAEEGQRGCEGVTERPDIILMDLQMRGSSTAGKLARRLKSAPETSSVPIIGLSAHALPGERDKK